MKNILILFSLLILVTITGAKAQSALTIKIDTTQRFVRILKRGQFNDYVSRCYCGAVGFCVKQDITQGFYDSTTPVDSTKSFFIITRTYVCNNKHKILIQQ